ncbi:hypothetical protein HUB98_06120 [Paenibacillus barcinonensis]|uniref:Uncharacterized protein n=1 Tax=Paenibacillus barcinonensis TaxID=198119 RepID=A0A2V4VDH6_PAEBA|nr:hypothetical protein [Paenibacillus barcinonensis]PYE51588.1 hypothetical protein DFQ00_102383 [Paenibacillus barcinonensis]QKS55956.1 hypothetical protein HUB98_06120 [Paenibacillus barcinonensis]
MELIFREKVILYNLISERYHELKSMPETRDDNSFQEIEDMYIKFGAHLEKEYGKDWWK